MRTIRLFLASSSELTEDRKALEAFINGKLAQGIPLELAVWEDSPDTVGKDRLQTQYRQAIQGGDIVVMLFSSKVGQYTTEAFEDTFGAFNAAQKPLLFTYFKDVETNTGSANKNDLMSLWAFQAKLTSLGRSYTPYKDVEGLKSDLADQLDKLAANGFAGLGSDKGEAVAVSGDTNRAILNGAGAVAQGTGAIALSPGAALVTIGDNATVTLQAGKTPPPPPFQAPKPQPGHVGRPLELALLKRQLLDADRTLVLPNTVALHGFGGVGKTTLARLFCDDPAVRQAFRDGILWVPVGMNPPDQRGLMTDLVTALTGQDEGCATLPGAQAKLQAALVGHRVLLVLDDVWDEGRIKELLEASIGCARLITTRNTDTVPPRSLLLDVGTMQETDARNLLGVDLPAGQDARLLALAQQLGYWPVLLRLANRSLHRCINQNMSLSQALERVEHDLARKGVLAFDPARDISERDQAVAATVGASLDLLEPADRQRYAELAVFPQDVPIPLKHAAELWQLTAGLEPDQSDDLIRLQLDPLSLLDYDGGTGMLRLHDVLRSYLYSTLADKASLHQRLAGRWGDRPAPKNAYAWRWLAFHRAQAIFASGQPARHSMTENLVALVSDETWQQSHEDALNDLPALREALSSALEAATADDAPMGIPLIVQAADALARFRREHLRPEPIFELARLGDLDSARRRNALFDLDDHWHQALLLMVAWLAPPQKREQARKLCDEIQAELGGHTALRNLLGWVRTALWDEAAPRFDFLVPPDQANEALVEELLKRVGGAGYDREFIMSVGLDPNVQDPDRPPPTRGLYREKIPGVDESDSAEERTTTRYLAELDGPYLVAYAAKDPAQGTEALKRYVSVYSNYSYPEYRFSSLWLLLEYVVRFPGSDGGGWVQDAVERILVAALGGGSVEFEQGLTVAALALRASAQDPTAREALEEQAHRLIDEAMSLKPGRDRAGSDRWGHHKRRMLAHAQALGWLLQENGLAGQVLQEALALADSGFAGYQAPACLALAEAIHVCREGDPQEAAEIGQALDWARQAAHNVQDPTFCARMTARVNAMRRHWWQAFDLDGRARLLPKAGRLPEFAALHRVGQDYGGRRPDALRLPAWATADRSFDGLQKLYQRPLPDFFRLNDSGKALEAGDEVAVPDPGLTPHLAARLAAEALAQADHGPLPPERLRLLRALVPYAVPSPTALDAVLTRLVLAQARRETPPDLAEAEALEAVLARRPAASQQDEMGELIARQRA